MTPDLQVDVVPTGGDACTLRLTGTLDINTYDQIEDAFARAMADGRLHITVDLGGIDFISSAGFGAFIEALGTLREAEGDLRFVNPSPTARDIFDLLGVLMDCCDFD